MVSKDTARVRTSVIQECSHCRTRIDVSRFEPLQQIDCPSCSKSISVQGNIDRFRLESIAGRGGNGLVYQAFDPHLGRRVALKVVRQDKASDEAFQQLAAEAGVTAQINHPQVVRVYSVGNVEGRIFIAMEVIGGGSLDDLITKKGALPEARVLDMAIQVASGLEAAQRVGLVHRDMKPGNILFDLAGAAKVVDFGLAIMEQSAVGSGEVWGTPYYLPPERLQGIAEDFRADIYALGTTLFHALTGRPPFEGKDGTAVAMKRLQTAAPSVLTYAPSVSNATAFVLKKMMERDADARFQSYQELIESLQFARNELSKPAARARVVVNSQQESSAGMWITVACIGVLLVGGSTAFFLMRKPAEKKVVSVPVEETAPAEKVEEPGKVEPATVEPAKVEATPIDTPQPETARVEPPKTEPKKSDQPSRKSAKEALRAVGTSFVPSPGVYTLVNRANNGVLQCSATTMSNGAEVALTGASKAHNQRWMIKNNADGICRLLAFQHFKALDIQNGSDQDSAIISMYAPADHTRQRWAFREVEPGWYAILAECSGKALTADSPEPSGAGQIGQREYAGKPEQQWRLNSLGALPEGVDLLDPVVTRQMPVADPVKARVISAMNPHYVTLNIEAAATADSRRGMYSMADDKNGSPRPLMRGLVDVAGVPFHILQPKDSEAKDNITLRGGKGQCKEYAQRVEIPVGNIPLARLHVVGGVAGWAYPWNPLESPVGTEAAQITIEYQGGKKQEIILRSGLEFMDHTIPSGSVGVSGSAKIEGLAVARQQLRYFAKPVLESQPVTKIVIESFDNQIAPTFFALTGEKR
jgi:serine/threonine protein kinase